MGASCTERCSLPAIWVHEHPPRFRPRVTPSACGPIEAAISPQNWCVPATRREIGVGRSARSAPVFSHTGITMTTKNHTYAALSPLIGGQSVAEQMRAAHRYRNKLCELELARRAAADSLARQVSPEYAALAAEYDAASAAVDDIYQQLRGHRASARKRVDPTAEQRLAITAAKKRRAEIVDRMKAAKARAYAAIKELQAPHWADADVAVPRDDETKPATRKRAVRAHALAAMESAGIDGGQRRYENACREARAESGCYWGTYLAVEDACKEFSTGTPPRYERWDESGTVAVQLMGGVSVEDAYECDDTRLRVDYTAGDKNANVWMRIGSEGRDPIWAKIPVIMHRPLPAGGDIRWAYLHRERDAHGYRWRFRFVVNEAPAEDVDEPERIGEVVALHFGWRIMGDDRIRSIVWAGSDGRRGEVLIDEDYQVRHGREIVATVNGREHAEAKQSMRSTWLDEFRPMIVEWLGQAGDIVPEWLRERTKTIAHWRSFPAFHSLCEDWYRARFTGDEIIFRRLDEWRKADKILWQSQQRASERIIARRNDQYRSLLKRLSAEYRLCAMAKVDWKTMATKDREEDDVTQTSYQRANSRLAAPGVASAFAREYFGNRIVMVDAKNITTICRLCGHDSGKGLDRSKRECRCHGCGETWDQDVNAVANTLARGEVVAKTRAPLAGVAAQGDACENDPAGDSPDDTKNGTARKVRRNRRSVEGL
jgi:hypothetical protein